VKVVAGPPGVQTPGGSIYYRLYDAVELYLAAA